MAEINWTAEAEMWLKDIHDYIAQDDPDATARQEGEGGKPLTGGLALLAKRAGRFGGSESAPS